MDLLHCESMSKLDSGTLNRLLEKNYWSVYMIFDIQIYCITVFVYQWLL